MANSTKRFYAKAGHFDIKPKPSGISHAMWADMPTMKRDAYRAMNAKQRAAFRNGWLLAAAIGPARKK